MAMSNFIDERERHAELYGKYTDRQRDVLGVVEPLKKTTIDDNRMTETLHTQGISDTEISWLKRTGHVLPTY